MSIMRRMLATRAMRVHLFLFLALSTVFVVLDLVQGVDSEYTFLGLDWAYILVVLWLPILVVHGLATWLGNEVDGIDDAAMHQLRGRWFGGV